MQEIYVKKYNQVYCKTHKESQTALIADSSIDCIYNPLSNNLHYGPTLAALKAGKYVLLGKPSVSNAQEARSLFHHAVLQSPHAPVLLEASHYHFHPAWHLFLSQFDATHIEHADIRAAVPAGFFPGHDIRFSFELEGGLRRGSRPIHFVSRPQHLWQQARGCSSCDYSAYHPAIRSALRSGCAGYVCIC